MVVKKLTFVTKPICGYFNGCKNQQLLQYLYVGIVMFVKEPTFIMKHICGYYNGCEKPSTITKPICRYYIFEMTLWKL
jgi:hypothetical protein